MNDMFSLPLRKELRPYQSDAIAHIRASVLAGNHRIVVALPTGAGKTLIASHIVLGALAKGGSVVFCVPMVTLVDQTIAAFEAEGIESIGAMQANHIRTSWTARVQVASIQTLGRRTLPNATIVLVDECHLFSQVIIDWMKARPDLVFIGLSATPGRVGMAEDWEDLIVPVTTQDLIETGYLSKFTVYAASTPDLSGVKIVAGEFNAPGAAEVMEQAGLVGDILQNYLLHGEGRPTLGFATNVAHAKRMADEFTTAGISSAYVEGRTDTLERQAIQAQFRRGEIKVIWSVRTMTAGVDLPVSGIIDAAPTRSAMLHQQKIGRGLRKNAGTEDLKIWDHAGNTLRLGFVDKLEWSELLSGKRSTSQAKRKAPLPKACAECHLLMEPKIKVCPGCGAERRVPSGFVETAEGELVALNAETGKANFPNSVKAEWYQGLLGLEKERGYKPGWAYRNYRKKFSADPVSTFPKTPKTPTPEIRSWATAQRIAFIKAKEAGRA